MGIEQVYAAILSAVAAFGEANGYAAASDAFTFDAQPRTDQSAWYVDPPRVHVEGYVGGAQNVTGMFAIWLSREAGDHATAAAGRLTGDLGRVAAVLVRAELGDDVNVHEAFTLDTQPREADAVTVIGVLRLSADWDEE